MSELITYLLQANVALILFYAGYYFLLRNLTFYTLNRYYLLFSLIFSTFYPLINLGSFFNKSSTVPEELLAILPDLSQFQFMRQRSELNQLTEWLFWLGAVVIFLKLLIKLGGILRIHLNSTSARWNFYSYRKSPEDINPFSFWRVIYLNPSKHKEDELDKIFKHESVHIKQLHSLDILIAEIAYLLFWYNPFCWLIQKAIYENTEFIADRKVLSTGVDKQSYQYSLLSAGTSLTYPLLGNHFNIKNLKKRIMMMNKKQTSNKHLTKYLFVLPAVIAGSLIFSSSNAGVNVQVDNLQQNTVQDSLSSNGAPIYFIDGKKSTQQEMSKLDTKDIAAMNIYKGEMAIEKYGDEAKNGVIVITLKKK